MKQTYGWGYPALYHSKMLYFILSIVTVITVIKNVDKQRDITLQVKDGKLHYFELPYTNIWHARPD